MILDSSIKSLTPTEYWETIGKDINSSLTTAEFWVLAGRPKIESLIAEFQLNLEMDCCQDAGEMTQSSKVYVDICMTHLKEILDAHIYVESIGTLQQAIIQLKQQPSAVGIKYIEIVAECDRLKKELMAAFEH